MSAPQPTGPSRNVKSPWITLLLLLVVIALIVAVIVTRPKDSAPDSGGGSDKPVDSQVLVGRWVREDGDKFININKIHPDGKVEAEYFNPAPKKVSKANITQDGGKLGVFVEITDVGYPGATYTLTYLSGDKKLSGKYFQPSLGETYQVTFEKE